MWNRWSNALSLLYLYVIWILNDIIRLKVRFSTNFVLFMFENSHFPLVQVSSTAEQKSCALESLNDRCFARNGQPVLKSEFTFSLFWSSSLEYLHLWNEEVDVIDASSRCIILWRMNVQCSLFRCFENEVRGIFERQAGVADFIGSVKMVIICIAQVNLDCLFFPESPVNVLL